MKKRLLSLTLAFVMVLGMLPVQAFAAAVELPVSDGRVDITDTPVGSYTLQYLDVYLQSTYEAVNIVSATQDGTTINVVLSEDTDPAAALQAGFGGSGSGTLSHSNNKCTLSNGSGSMTYAVAVRLGPQMTGSATFTINFSIPMGEACTVTQPAGEGFTFTGMETAYKDSEYSFQIAVNEGYDGSNMVVKVNGDPVEGDNGTYTVASVPGELVITVEGVVAKEVCNITTPVGEGFTFTGAETVYKGESYTFKIAVDNAYDASNMAVKAGETELTGNNGTYTIEAVDEDTVISVTGIVKKTAYTVTTTEGTGYTISGQNTSYAGEPYTFTVTVDDAVYKASEIVVKVNGEPVTLTDGKYTIEALDGDKAVTVENVVERQLFTVNKPEVEGVTFTGRDDVREGKPYTFSIAVDNKYISTDMVVRVNDAEVELTNGNYTIESASENIEISIEGVVKKKEYTVTKPSVEGVTVTGADTVLETDPYTFTVTVSEIYDISNMVVMVNDEPVALANGSYTIPSVAADVTITVSGLTKKDVCVVEKPTGNKFTFEGADFAYKGSDYAFTVMPQLGYEATVTVNGEVITGTTNQYAVKADGETLTIVVTTERVDLPDKELTVTDNGGSYTAGVTSNQITTTLTNSYFATITGIKVTGAVVNEAFEDGRTVYFMLDKDTPDTATVDIEFLHTTSNSRVKLVQSKWSLALVDGEGGLKTAVTVRYSSSNRYDKTSEYTLIFFREIPAEEPPARIVESATAEVWKGWPLEIKLNTYFTDADTYYLVDGETKTQIEGNVYTFVSPVAGEQTLVFLAENEIGFSEPVTVTVSVKDVESGIYINHASGNGSLDSVQFCNADGEPIEGIEISYDRPTRVITVVLPKDYEVNGTVKTKFQLTQNASGYPYVSQVTETVANRPYAARFTEKSIQLTNGAAEFVFYYYNKDTGAVDAGGQTKFSISIKIKNDRPELAEGVEAAVAATVTAGQEYELDLSPIFTDIDNDTLTYQYKVGDGDWQDCGTSFTYSNTVAADYVLTFRAFDTKDYSTEYYTVTLTVENVKDTYDMTVSVPAGLEPKFYVSTGFEDGVDTQGASLSAVAGETADGMTAYTVSYPQNAEMLSVRTENWGGMAFPAEENGTVTLRQVKLSVVDYEEIAAESTNTITYDECKAVAGTDGWLLVTGQEYTYTAVPEDAATLATVTETETLETGADVYVREMMMNIKNPITITVTTGAKAQLYNIDTNKYYFASELDAKIVKDNGDGTTTYFFVGDTKASGTCFVYRVSMDGKITKAGYLAWGKQNVTVTYTEADKSDSYRLDDYSGTGMANSGMTEDSVLLNINSRNHLHMAVGDSKTLKAYRAWEIIKISYQNYILTPDFTYTVLSGEDVVRLTEKDSPSTADGDWMTLTALKEGVAVIEVTYDALEVTGGSYDGIYGASDPARTGIVVVQVGGSDDASVDFGIDCFASIGKSGSSNISYNPGSKKAWDAEFDTLYFTEDSGELNLTPTADSAIAEVAVSHDKGATWKPLSDTDGVYTAEIVPGNNILRVTTASGTAYQVVRGDKVSVTFKEVDGSSDGDGVVEAGETIRVSLIGLHTPIPKMAGNYNPGFGSNNDGYSSHHLNYTANGEAIYGSGAQYNFITAANYVDIVMPADGSSVSLTDGYIGVGVIGLKNFVNGGDSHRNIPDTGCSTRGSDTTFHTRSILPEITVSAGGTSAPNSAPIVRADAVTEGEIYDDQKFAIYPDTLFQDPDGDTLTFTVSVNGGEPTTAELGYKFKPEQAGIYTLTFTASDGEETVQHTVTVTVKTRGQEGGQTNNFGLEESEIAGRVTISFEDKGVRVAGETGLKFPVPLGTIIEPTSVPFKTGENIAQVTKRLLDHLNIGMRYSGTLESGFYLGAITNFEVDNTPYTSMGEFDAGVGSGWMITQNNVFINKGASEFKVANGDILKWQYTCQLGADIGDDYATERIENVEKLISEIGDVTLESEATITEARAAYAELTDAQKQKVENYTTLTAAEAALAELKTAAAANQAAADAVKAKIAAIGNVTLTSESAITEARDAYNALTDAQKALVDNLGTLTDAETALAELKAEDAANRAAAANVEVKIATIGEVSLAKEDQITAARTAYDALTDVQKTLVTNYETLTAAETALAELKAAAAADQAAANAVKEKIAAIGEVTLESETVIAEARTAYEALTDAQQNLVDNYATLTAAETALAELKAVAADQAAANAVKEKIAAIGEVVMEKEGAIVEARAAYDALTDARKVLVDNYDILTAAETALAELKATAAADQAAANAVKEKIAAIGEVTLESETVIAEARTAYDGLTEAQKNLVDNYNTLTAAEAALAVLKAANDQAAADAVEMKITAIGEVTLDSEAAIAEARAAYDALTEARKALVENYETLTTAEAVLAELKAAAAADQAAANAVKGKIAAIGEVTLESEAAIAETRTAYEALTDAQKNLVDNYTTLTAAETVLAELKAAAAADQAAANAVKEKIAAIGEVTLEKEGAIVEARTAYDALTEAQKNLVDNYATLTAAETALAELKAAAAADQAAANAVKEKIAAIGEVTLESEAAITEARAAYDALTDAQKDLVDNYVFLTAAEATLNALKAAAAADRAAANAVEEKIAAIGEVSLDKENKIIEARTAYDALTEARKALVENYETLTTAEAVLAELKAAAAADQAAANAVETKIAAIGTVTLESEVKIAEAREAYNALTDRQKELVENYETLTAAEDALAALKSADLDEMYEAAAETLLAQTPETGTTGGEWLVFGLSRALDKELTAAKKTAYEAAVQALLNSELNDSGQLNANKPTENARVALALTALGCDPANYNGKNLLSALEDTAWTAKQGNNSAAFALLAFNAADYHASNEDTLIQSLLANQLSTGGWNINSGSADADTTAMVVQALAPYYQSNPNIKTAVDKALVYLKGLMNTKGQLNNGVDEPSVETVSQMIVALCELGIDPTTWKTEHDVNLLHGLASFYVDGSKKGFAHTGDNTYNQMATEQAFYTMVAYKRFLNKDATSLYDMSDARVQKYTITVSDSVNGTVIPSKSIAAAGETITVSVAPNNGYKLKSLSMNGAALTANESGVYSFTMPEQVVTLTAVFEKLETVIEQDTTVSNGTASAVIPDTAIDEAVAAVGGTEDKVVTIIPTETGSADKVEVSIPADSAGKIADADAALIVQAPAGVVEIPKEILTQMEGTADQTVKITVEARTQEHIADAGITVDTTGAVIVEVTIQKGDTKVTDFDSNQLTITIPVTNGFVAGKTYDVIVISEGKANETVKGLCIQQGEQKVIQVKINHLSTFVVLNPVTADLVEAMDALAVADAKKVTYEKIMAIETAYDKLTIAEKLQIRDAYKAFQDQVEMFELYLEMIVEEAAEELEDFYKDLDQDDYSAKAWKKIKEVYNDALDALTEAHYEEEVYELLEEYLEYLEEAAAGELEVTFRLIGDWKHDDGVSGHDEYVTWIETTEYNMPAGSTIYDLFIKAIDDFDLNQKGASKNYVESIQAPDILGGYWLGEFDNGPNSGWMYTINGDHPGYGLKEQGLEDGDEVIWHYVDDYTLEERKTTSKYYERWLEADDIAPETWVKRNLDKIVTIEGKGEVKPELKMSHIGKDVKFTFTPAEGWVIKSVYVDGKDKGAIETYTYKDLAMDARIEVVFAQNVAFQMNFVDVSESQWFYDDVYFAVSNGLFNGIDEVTFAPGASMTRAMLVTVLYRLEGQPAVYGGSAFTDVAAGQWYTDAVIWATRNGIVNGLGNGKFGANDNVTREQMAAILYRYAQNCGYDTTARADLKGYTDAAKISSYAQEAMSWANAMGLINGRTYNTLAPTGTATRAEVAAIFHRFVENIVK